MNGARLIVLAFLVLASLVLAGPGRAAAVEVVEIATGEWPPYTSASAPASGTHADRVARVLGAAGYQVRFHFLPWNRAYARTVAGDFAASLSWYGNEARRRELLFPENPIEVIGLHAYYRKSRFPGGLRAASLRDLVDRRLKFVGVRSYWYASELEAMAADVDYVPEGRMVWRMLDAGRADVAIEAAEVARRDIEETLGPGRLDEFATTGAVKVDPLYIAFSRANPLGAELMRAWDAHAATVR